MPRDVWALARLFPVLSGVPEIARSSGESLADPHALRQRAFVALRDLLAQIARRDPLVIFIDDVQWGDSDSAALLREVMRPPNAPALLLVMTYRDAEDQASAFLLETRALWPSGAEVREHPVGPLEIADARSLAMALLGSKGAEARAIADAVARESGGSPFLVEELARGASASDEIGSPPAASAARVPPTLDQIVRTRLNRLTTEARQLVEIVAVGGRPLPVAIVRDASATGVGLDAVVGMLRMDRFVRSGFRDGHEVIESTHDRIRETILATLPAAVLRERHAQLARALEAMPGADLEALSLHLLGAGDEQGAARYAERAAEQAVAKLAFNQAVRLLRLTLRIIAPGAPDVGRLSRRLAAVLEWSGRGGEAALVYLDAARDAPADERIELERAAAEQLLACGRIDEGATVLRRVLASIGIDAPGSALGALFWLFVYRLWLRLIGLRFVDRAPEDVRREDRIRVDALYAIGLGLSVVNVIVGACMQSRHLILALEVGDRSQVLRAMSLEAAHLASEGGAETTRERMVTEIAATLAESNDDTEGETFFRGSRAVGLFLRGHWSEAQRSLESAYERYPNHRAGWHANANLFAVYALSYLGDLKSLARRAKQLLAEAEQRNDLYIIVNLRTRPMVDIALAYDAPDEARNHIREAMDQWSQHGFLVQHWQAMVWGATTELYVGDGARACETLDRHQRALKRSFLLQVQYIRATTAFVRARSLIAAIEAAPARRLELVAGTRRIARRLRRERMHWTEPLACLAFAAAANAMGERAEALASLESAVHGATLADMPLYAWAAQHRIGLLLGGVDGAQRVNDAEAAMTGHGIHVPRRYAALLVPGRWDATVGRKLLERPTLPKKATS